MPTREIGDLPLVRGGSLPGVHLAYETWGEPAEEAILVCHALTGDASAGSDPQRRGWWDGVVGPGCAVDPRSFYVVSVNVPGSCYGSTGPDAEGLGPDGRPFPEVSVEDMVAAQARLLQALGVRRLRLVVGGSIGGMQALAWAGRTDIPVEQVIAIGAADRLPVLQIALCHAQHLALQLGLQHGDAAGGLRAARAIAMATYRSDRHFSDRFGRRAAGRADRAFAVETYLDHHGERLVARFTAHSYLALSRAMTFFAWDAKVRPGTRVDLIAISSDWLFPPELISALHRRLAEQGVPGDYLVQVSDLGHDAFLADQAGTARLVRLAMERACGRRPAPGAPADGS